MRRVKRRNKDPYTECYRTVFIGFDIVATRIKGVFQRGQDCQRGLGRKGRRSRMTLTRNCFTLSFNPSVVHLCAEMFPGYVNTHVFSCLPCKDLPFYETFALAWCLLLNDYIPFWSYNTHYEAVFKDTCFREESIKDMINYCMVIWSKSKFQR